MLIIFCNTKEHIVFFVYCVVSLHITCLRIRVMVPCGQVDNCHYENHVFFLFRFRDDLAVFDDLDITESTLQILDSYLSKPHFDHVYMNNRTENPALVMLVKWVSGVAK